MPILVSCVIFLFIAIVASLAGMRLYLRPKEAMERVAGTAVEREEMMPVHPSLMFHDLVKRLGALVPASPKDVTVMQRRLIRAGYRSATALKALYGAKAIFGVLLPVLSWVVLSNSSMDPNHKGMTVLAAVVVGFFGPNEYVKRMGKAAPKEDSARAGQRPRPAGGVRRVGTRARPGHLAGRQGTRARTSRSQRRIHHGEPRIESRQSQGGSATQSG
jgi:hypothetical protein